VHSVLRPTEWIQERSDRSGLLRRKVLGPSDLSLRAAVISTDPPFYKATTSLNTLALVDPLIADEGPEGASGFFAMVLRRRASLSLTRKTIEISAVYDVPKLYRILASAGAGQGHFSASLRTRASTST
jgi:hypothetical protein